MRGPSITLRSLWDGWTSWESPSRCLVDTATELSVSSAFTGVGGFELARTLRSPSLDAFVGEGQRAAVRFLFPIEHSAACRFELSMHPHLPECPFGDMCDAINSKVKRVLEGHAARMPYEYLT